MFVLIHIPIELAEKPDRVFHQNIHHPGKRQKKNDQNGYYSGDKGHRHILDRCHNLGNTDNDADYQGGDQHWAADQQSNL